ncbi:hypothetical protein ASE00_08710 [Sphingomonas sp. Root710]|nr:hypothetical protein ASE00_08710 [Sphingomonas sp. Root710]
MSIICGNLNRQVVRGIELKFGTHGIDVVSIDASAVIQISPITVEIARLKCYSSPKSVADDWTADEPLSFD